MSSSVARAQTSGRSLISRWPQSAMTRIGARRRRAYSKPSSTGTCWSRAPQRTSTGQRTRSRSCRGSSRISARPAPIASVWRVVPCSSAVDGALRQQVGVRDLEAAEHEPPQPPRPGDPPGPAGGDPARLHDPGERDHHLGPAGRARDPGGRGEHDAADELGPAFREPQRDHAAERVPEHVHGACQRRRRARPRSPRARPRPAAVSSAPWPGRSGISSRRPGRSGASSLKFQAAPP